jgi:hypothetical protein
MAKLDDGERTVTKNATFKTLSFDEVLAELESAKREFKEFDNGQRKALYRSMQRMAEKALLVKTNETIESRYRKKMGEKDGLYAALRFIFDAKSENQEASKRAIALRYLIVKLKVSVGDIATAIPKHGGIEKLARLAAKSRSDEGGGDLDDEDDGDEDKEKAEEADDEDKTERKFGRQISLGLSPNLAKKLNRFRNKTRIKIVGYVHKVPDELPTIEVKKIIEAAAKKKDAKSKAKAAAEKPDDDASDWEE